MKAKKESNFSLSGQSDVSGTTVAWMQTRFTHAWWRNPKVLGDCFGKRKPRRERFLLLIVHSCLFSAAITVDGGHRVDRTRVPTSFPTSQYSTHASNAVTSSGAISAEWYKYV